MVKEGFAAFMVALIKLLIQSYGKLIQDVLLSICCDRICCYARHWVCDVKFDSAETLQGGFCNTRFVAARASERTGWRPRAPPDSLGSCLVENTEVIARLAALNSHFLHAISPSKKRILNQRALY